MARKTDVLIIGAGQAGLAMSRCLSDLAIPHVVLDRGAVGQRWRAERWASLRLLSPNWMTRLPGWAYDGDDPNGYMHKDEVVGFLNRYARSFDAPIEEYTSVSDVRQTPDGFRVKTSKETFFARSVVIATGACDVPGVPEFARRVSASIQQITPNNYVHADALDPGGVLVVGAAATGVQLAEEIQLSGRQVTLAVGSHVRLPRHYRGRDTLDWLDACEMLSEPRDPAISTERALAQSSLQLIGSAPARDIGLSALKDVGVRIAGRIDDMSGTRACVSASLGQEIDAAEGRRNRTLERIDTFIHATGQQAAPANPDAGPVVPDGNLQGEVDLTSLGIRTILWATGFRRTYPWLNIPVLTPSGEILQSGGVTPCAGLFTLGLPFMRRRNSTFIDGVGPDAQDLSTNIAHHLERTARLAA